MAPSHEERIKSLKAKREAFSIELQELKDMLNDPEVLAHGRDLPYREISMRLEDIQSEYAAFAKNQQDLDTADENGDLLRERMKLKSLYTQVRAQALDFLPGNNVAITDTHAPHGNAQNQPSPYSQIESLDLDVHLPKINLPIFSGHYEEWPGFADQFRSTVHENQRINDCKKLMYLRSCLKNEALRAIESLSNSASNYAVAWNILEKRYHQPAIIVTNHLKALFDTAAVNRSTHRELRPFLNSVEAHYRSLKSLNQPTTDSLLIHLLLSKVDKETALKWKEHTCNEQFPTIETFFTFLHERCQILEPFGNTNNCQTSSTPNYTPRQQPFRRPPPRPFVHNTHAHTSQVFNVQTPTISCNFCKGSHYPQQCETFLRLSIPDRIKFAKTKNSCLNCLRPTHRTSECRSTTCRRCYQKHHTLLHQEIASTPIAPTQVNATCLKASTSSQILLSTAVINVMDKFGRPHPCRVLLDSCSQSHFITKRFFQGLQLATKSIAIPINGMNDMSSVVKAKATAQIQSRYNNFSKTLSMLIVEEISQRLPVYQIEKHSLNIPENTYLADPQFHEPAGIDGLLGAQVFWDLLCAGQITLNENNMKLQQTQLGWIITGEVPIKSTNRNTICNLSMEALNSSINKFWELEERGPEKLLSMEEQNCEAHYIKHTQRDPATGRYIVQLPFKKNNEHSLGNSHSVALRRFLSLERQLDRNPEMKVQYVNFMREYEQLNHMSKISHHPNEGYFLPHHAVTKSDSLTTKIRVVFDASAKSTSGISLNETLMVGPVVQEDLFSIVTRFRVHTYVLTADITKMYRQIILNPEHRKYHKILWREGPTHAIQTYQLNTVTYGTACASFLATRTLLQLAEDEEKIHPEASKILKTDFYVDDLLTGADDIGKAQRIRDELIALTAKGGFQLRQWLSNEPRLVAPLQKSDDPLMTLDLSDEKKTLGLYWHPTQDTLGYTLKNNEPLNIITKRTILSRIAQLFDPLGLIGPIIVQAKLIMQSLWKTKQTWDEPLPIEIHATWVDFQAQLHLIRQFSIPRRIVKNNCKYIQIHGFCDASERAYGACIYLRTTTTDGNHYASLICSKSRVAPLKMQSLPRLELCAALLLINLYKVTSKALRITTEKTYLWTDSMIVLHWINSQPHTLKQFVGNRVSEIQQHSNSNLWRHIPSKDNPGDILSRGATPSELNQNQIWKTGPRWLSQNEDQWPITNLQTIDIPETRKITVLANTITENSNMFEKFSNFQLLTRVVAYCFRFYHHSLKKTKHTGQLTTDELKKAHDRIIKLIQLQEFHNDRKALETRVNDKPYKGRLAALHPFLDACGLLRVGGRLSHADLTYDQKHPLLLPNKHPVTRLIVQEYHLKQGHAGAQATLNAIRQTYWPINGKTVVKTIIRKCIKCYRARPTIPEYPMGNLPKDRVTLKRPFLSAGIDYCGPFHIKEKRLRNTKQIKCYVAIFICLATKAVHIELVSDLSTDAFLAALRRFFARRGKSTDLYSDNATNFVGANHNLRDLHELLQSKTHNDYIKHHLVNENINWHFIPPRAPHFGGLWEAAVKSFKYHLIRVLGNTLLTYEAFNTCIIEIEAILNSRPITPLSSDPTDYTALTPGHFLIGDAITNIPERDFSAVNTGRLVLWEHIQQIKQHFWARWRKEYLNELTVRQKWHQVKEANIQEGLLVIVKEDNLPPFHWPLGRILEKHPGKDGVTRVVTIKTSSGTYKRPIKKLAPLPIDIT
ncbi:hypothetical protein ANTPLA_LOCUS11030 [Anthophora plagiata]